ncbi:hypothetical protein QX776_17965 [Alteromonadaceae bacterium BrNp21-10]|nr:hypothetical protein [Alteromonadaceae bacterium BrNp21-10]
MSKLVGLFCDIDDFAKYLSLNGKKTAADGTQKRQREEQMTTSEIMTIVVIFDISHYRDFKNYSLGYAFFVYKNEFPN